MDADQIAPRPARIENREGGGAVGDIRLIEAPALEPDRGRTRYAPIRLLMQRVSSPPRSMKIALLAA
jgi:hypothetical protein